MDETSQIVVPPSFVALHTAPNGRLALPRAELAQRYELCEDMACALAERCRTVHAVDGVAQDEVLRRCLLGLRAEPAVLSAAQAEWVVRRCAELLDWPQPEDGALG
jgi:hypothetical protein